MSKNIKKAIKDFSEEFCKKVWFQLRDKGIKGIGISGSYARGTYSLGRPDINFLLFIKEKNPRLILRIGEIISNLNKKYSSLFNLRPEFHPERFAFPWQRDKDKIDVFFKIALFPIEEKDSPMPFGRPSFIIEGHKNSLKLLYGKNYLEDLKISITNEDIIKGVKYSLGQWKNKIILCPLSYNLESDTDLFFNESLIWGKLAIQQFSWIQGIKNKLNYSRKRDRKIILDKIYHKEKLKSFIKVPEREKRMIKLILESRSHYNEWKNNKKIAKKVYIFSFHLLNYFLREAKRVASE